MSFYQTLQHATAHEREHLLSAPIIEACRRGEISRQTYLTFLAQAFYHVRHTVPLLMATGGKLGQEYEWVRGAIREYIDEEYGHQEWILSDIRACGGDAEAVRHGQPEQPIELMVAFLYDQIARGNPMAFFGMVQVLEGTSVAIATTIADQLKSGLGLPPQAMSYLSSHGALDQEHLKFFASLMDRVENPADQGAIVHAAKVVYRLYGDMLYSLTERH
ncbi:TenA family transcriptional regulator [Aeromonas rivuli]|uniref:TenA family transcriptional regulator n=1 Tax=Aeromonas rivuli TaxID=648794 RepID=UPI0005A689CE|nr:iron-containing redox enzyme family protein [Aeromonas rivuli]UBO73250.1 iron-containing redox enzyme family protein [Aeromonas rivuli]